MIDYIGHNYALRDLMQDDHFYLTCISSRKCLEDTYSQHLHKTGLVKTLRYKIILWLMYMK
jgi:hypothetical protein